MFVWLGNSSKVKGFYLVGGSVYLGFGVLMVVLFGKIVVDCLMVDWVLIGWFCLVVISGGMLMLLVIVGFMFL